jgi:hypothetical protein
MKLCVAALALAAVALAQEKKQPEPPVQPIPYSHRQHLALGLKCKNCHEMPDPGEMMGIPAAAKCMTCHQSVKPDSPAIQTLAAHARDNRPIKWVRVYQIPSFVEFSHKAHLAKDATLRNTTRPGGDTRDSWRETDISMGGCMTAIVSTNQPELRFLPRATAITHS